MLRKRCDKCRACQNIEKVKPSVLKCADPPFSSADDGVVQLWNQTLYDNPCEEWSPDEQALESGSMLLLDPAIRPYSNTVTLIATVELIAYPPAAWKLSHVKANLGRLLSAGVSQYMRKLEVPTDGFTYSLRVQDTAADYLVLLASRLDVQPADLDDLVYDATSNPASDINNSGVEGQVRYLCQQLGTKAVAKALKEIAKEGDNQASDGLGLPH